MGDNMPKPFVTVLIDTFNHERFIEEALVSVLEQGYPSEDAEVVVVDDGSTDRTPEIVAKLAPRVRLIRKANGGQASAFNAAIPEARGEIVAFLDGDDWWAPGKLKSVAEAMAADASLGIVGHGIILVHRDGRQQTEVLREGFRFRANTPEGARLFRLRQSLMGTSRMTIRADLLRRIGPVPSALRIQADAYLFTLAAVLAEAHILPEALTYYRYHDENGFQLAATDPARLRNKQISLDTLAKSLAAQLEDHGIDRAVARLITSPVQAEADQIRLVLDGGSPLETFCTEWTLYDIHHPSATTVQRFAKRLALVPALFLPPRAYYNFRNRAVKNPIYRRLSDRMDGGARGHVENEWRSTPPPRSTAAHKT
jgi:glycosyltransferase involved in cell wall biosynthesis